MSGYVYIYEVGPVLSTREHRRFFELAMVEKQPILWDRDGLRRVIPLTVIEAALVSLRDWDTAVAGTGSVPPRDTQVIRWEQATPSEASTSPSPTLNR